MPFLSGWGKRKEIRYGTVFPDSNLTDFPVLLTIAADSDIAAELTSGGGITITSDDETTELPFGLYPSSDPTSGDVILRFKSNVLSGASTGDVIGYIYYDAGQSTTEDKANTVSNDYGGFIVAGDYGSGDIAEDWVTETKIAGSGGLTSSDLVSAPVGEGWNFDGSGKLISLNSLTGNFPDIDGAKTIEHWIQHDGTTADGVYKWLFSLVPGDGGSHGNAVAIRATAAFSTPKIEVVQWGNGLRAAAYMNSPVSIGGDTWFLSAYRSDASWASQKIFFNGVDATFGPETSSGSQTGTTGASRVASFNNSFPDPYGNRPQAEIRVSTVARADAWLEYAYKNDATNSDTFTLGTEETGTPDTPDPTDIADLLAWYNAEEERYDATSGGSLVTTDGAQILSWAPYAGSVSDRLTQATSANRPVYDAVKEMVVSAGGPGGLQQWFDSTGITLDRRDFTAAFVVELITLRSSMNLTDNEPFHFFTIGDSDGLNLYYSGDGTLTGRGLLSCYDGSTHESDSIPLAGTRVLIVFVGTGSALKVWINDTLDSSASVLSSGSVTLDTVFGNGAGAAQMSFKDVLFYDRALTDDEVTDTLVPWSHTRGVPETLTDQIICIGDSITVGYGASVNRSYPQLLTFDPTMRIQITAESGITLASLISQQAFDHALLIPNEMNVVVIWAGTNDISALSDNAVDLYADLVNYVDDWRTAAAGVSADIKIVAVTPLPRGSGAIGGEYSAYRDLILANSGSVFDAVADPLSDTGLAAAWGDGTYDYDDIHPNTEDGYITIAPIIQAAIEAALEGVTPYPFYYYYQMQLMMVG